MHDQIELGAQITLVYAKTRMWATVARSGHLWQLARFYSISTACGLLSHITVYQPER